MTNGSPDVAERVLAPLVIVLLALHVGFGFVPALLEIRNDFANYYVPARLVLSGEPLDRLYERDWLNARIARAGIQGLGSFVPHPPANALLLVPFAALGPGVAKAAWTVVLALAMFGSFLVLRSVLPLSPWLLGLVFLLPTASLSNALLYGQPYPLLLLLLCLSLSALLRGRPLLCGVLLAPVVALKLYAVPFLLHFLWTRRFRAVFGLVLGVTLLTATSLALLGGDVHRAYAREVLPRSLAGEIQDPYSPIWGSFTSLAHRLFQAEPDLNPDPVADCPALARALSRGLPAALAALGVLAAARLPPPTRWAVLALAALAASPLTGSYHFVLLALPVAVLLSVSVRERDRARSLALLGLFAFSTSPLPHYFARFAAGWGNLLAYPRLFAVLLLLALAVRSAVTKAHLAGAAAFGLAAGLSAVPAPADESWRRVEARGYLLAEPMVCDGRLEWVTIDGDTLVVRTADGGSRAWTGRHRCPDPEVELEGSPLPGVDAADFDSRGPVLVYADRAARTLWQRSYGSLRALATGDVRHPRLSPDAAWVAYQSWERSSRSWDILAAERTSGRVVRVTSDRGNEVEPAWMEASGTEGERVVFASDRRRGLGSTALYSVPFRP